MHDRHPEETSNEDRAPRARRRAGSGDGSVAMRFRIAQLLRVPNGIIGKAMSAYSGLFEVDDARRAEIYRDIGSDLARHGKIAEAPTTPRPGWRSV